MKYIIYIYIWNWPKAISTGIVILEILGSKDTQHLDSRIFLWNWTLKTHGSCKKVGSKETAVASIIPVAVLEIRRTNVFIRVVGRRRMYLRWFSTRRTMALETAMENGNLVMGHDLYGDLWWIVTHGAIPSGKQCRSASLLCIPQSKRSISEVIPVSMFVICS